MFYSFFKSSPISDARLVYIKEPPAPPPVPGGAPKPGPEAAEKAETEKKKKEVVDRSKKMEARVGKEVIEKVKADLAAKSGELSDFIKAHPNYESGNWRAWNKEFAEKMGTSLKPDLYVKALQQIVFAEEKLKGDRMARADGKLGGYTLAALSHYSGQKLPVEVPKKEGNPRLAKLMQEAKQEKGVEDFEKMQFMREHKDQLWLDYVHALNEGRSDDEPSIAPSKEFFVSLMDDVIGHTGGNLDSTSLAGWERAFAQAGLSQDQLDELGISQAIEEKASQMPEEQEAVASVAPEAESSYVGEGFTNPYQKPAPEGPWSPETIDAYYQAYPGQEPEGGPKAPDEWLKGVRPDLFDEAGERIS